MDIKCKNCQKEVKNVTKRRQFCSQKCVYKFSYVPHPTKVLYKKCSYCSKLKYVRPCHNHFKKYFCSRNHQILFLKKNAFHKNCFICGSIFYCQPSQVKYRNRRTCSRKCRSKLRAIETIKNRIKNGFTKHQIDRCLRYSKQAMDWRKKVFARDNYTCQQCGIRGVYLEADHIKPWAFFPELRFELSNGRTLCRNCHNKTKINYKKMREKYGKNLVN